MQTRFPLLLVAVIAAGACASSRDSRTLRPLLAQVEVDSLVRSVEAERSSYDGALAESMRRHRARIAGCRFEGTVSQRIGPRDPALGDSATLEGVLSGDSDEGAQVIRSGRIDVGGSSVFTDAEGRFRITVAVNQPREMTEVGFLRIGFRRGRLRLELSPGSHFEATVRLCELAVQPLTFQGAHPETPESARDATPFTITVQRYANAERAALDVVTEGLWVDTSFVRGGTQYVVGNRASLWNTRRAQDALPRLLRVRADTSQGSSETSGVLVTKFFPTTEPRGAYNATSLVALLLCESSQPDVRCHATLLESALPHKRYLGRQHLYLWASAGEAGARLYRVPLNGSAPSALLMRGMPGFEDSIVEDRDGTLRVTIPESYALRADGAEFARPPATVRIAPRDFGDGSKALAASAYRDLPRR